MAWLFPSPRLKANGGSRENKSFARPPQSTERGREPHSVALPSVMEVAHSFFRGGGAVAALRDGGRRGKRRVRCGPAQPSPAQRSPPPSVAAAAAEGGMRRGGGTAVCRHASSRVPGRGRPRESDRRFSPRSSESGVAAGVTGAGGAASLPAGTGLARGHAPLQSQVLSQRRYHQRSSLWPCAGALPALPSWECRPIHRWQAVNDHGFRL